MTESINSPCDKIERWRQAVVFSYLFLGDSKRETYRLSTYHHFPLDVPIDPRRFARQGFYFTGYRDRVVCFR